MTHVYSFFKSIRAKASLLFFAVFVFIIFPVLFFIFSKVESTLEEADTRELRLEADKIMSQVKLDPLIIPLPATGYTLRLQHVRGVYSEDIFTSPDFPEVQSEMFLLDTYEYDTLKIVNVANNNSESGDIILSLARSNMRLLNQVNDVRLYLLAASLLAIALAGIIIFIAADFMIRPIRKIIDVAERINVSNSIGRVPVPDSEDESRKLAETLNAMLSLIE